MIRVHTETLHNCLRLISERFNSKNPTDKAAGCSVCYFEP